MLDKSVMLVGATLLLSAGLARYWLLGKRTRTIMVMGLLGVLALLLFSFLDLRATLLGVIPTADGALLWRYLMTTGHGEAVQLRLAFGLALGTLLLLRDGGVGVQGGAIGDGGVRGGVAGGEVRGAGVGGAEVRGGVAGGVAFGAGAVGLLSTFSVLSHGAVMGGWWPLASDLVHFLAAGAWAGGVVALVLAPVWDPPARTALVAAVRKLSTVGLVAVLALAVTGSLNALLHAGDPAAFLASSYVTALAVKLALVAVTVALAAANRFRFLPRLVAGGSARALRSSLRAEAVLLVLVLVATGWLSTTAVPHDMSAPQSGGVNVIDNVEGLIEHLGR